MKNSSLTDPYRKRRTFAIISHPDAGKTTLTEKLLLYSGMLHTAGMVRGRKERKCAASDWMAMEQERGISVTSSAMQFPYKDVIINVLDTPGHEDFSEDTYRTLTAADCAIMVIDAGKGVEKQTRKLFEVCRLRKIPVLTFINKMDMPGRDSLDLMNEVENVLQIQSFAANWPIGRDKTFSGVYDRFYKECLFFTKTASGGAQKAAIDRCLLDEAKAGGRIDAGQIQALQEELELLDIAGNAFGREEFLSGSVTPVFFGSALTNFGVEPFFDALVSIAPMPRGRTAIAENGEEKYIDPSDEAFSAFVFKIQANMNKKHRDSTAFLRICSGVFEKDLVVKHHRMKKDIRLSRPHGMMAGEREIIAKAYAGDIIGVINPGTFAIGDTVSLSGGFHFRPLPQFQPEIFAKVTPKDIKKRKAFDKGIAQLMEEGAIQLLRDVKLHGDNILAAVGNLQFDVLQHRLRDEYGVETYLTKLPYQCSAWILGNLEDFKLPTGAALYLDRFDRPMALFSSFWEKDYAARQNPEHSLADMIA
ncbi:MAG: peptide chain release factor 3 [Simkaniaceae bacterium]